MHSAQDYPGAVDVRHGHFRITGGYDPPVRIPETILKCVGFVGEVTHRDATGVSGDLCGTGFFVCIPAISPELPGMKTLYFVTAKHVVAYLKGREFFILVNKIGGGVTHITTAYGGKWWLHPTDPTADLAVIPIGYDSTLDVKAVELSNIGTEELLSELNVGIGDEVFTTGLFSFAPGTSRNLPIVRHGNIAMMPTEQIQTELGYADVYLVESRSIGGLSGSPVFVRPTLNVPIAANRTGVKNMFCYGHGGTLLGIMHGHWDINESAINKAELSHDPRKGVNMGIGIVVPAKKIFETLVRPELEAIRKHGEAEAIKAKLPSMDIVKPMPDTKPEQELTREDFEAALKKASRKVVRSKQ